MNRIRNYTLNSYSEKVVDFVDFRKPMQTFWYVFIPSELITRLKIDVRGRRLNLFIKYWKQKF